MSTEHKKKFYVTTPIYYVTARPHLGSLYSTVLADVATRWHKLLGEDTFFLTGTDEHGQKIAQAAVQAGKTPAAFVEDFIEPYKQMWHKYGIDYRYFIRTSQESHVKAVQEWIARLKKSGDIYKAYYNGWYCTPCETFITEKAEKKDSAQILCTECGRQTQYISEESYFFKLSAYQEKLLQFYQEHPDFITPSERLNEVIQFVKEGLRDLSISRTTVKWGIGFPEETDHTVYVWADALNNYITAIGYGDKARQEEFNYWWPADLQIMGKDIVRFHAVYWPAFLMASGLALPKKLLVHGWIKVNHQKMSKSLGNAVDPEKLLTDYGADAVRYYLVRHMAITQDAEFSIGDLEQRISSDLANDLGNLLNRLVTLAYKYNTKQVIAPQVLGQPERELQQAYLHMLAEFQVEMGNNYYYRALNSLWAYINKVNSYFHAQEPWKVAPQNMQRFTQIISAACHSLEAIAYLLWPIMPHKAEELLLSLGVQFKLAGNIIQILVDNAWHKTYKLEQIPPLFQKFEQKKIEEEKKEKASQESTMSDHNQITIDDLVKVMLVVGTIKVCEEIPKSDKLYKLQVDFGQLGMRQILSGIKQIYTAEQLLNKQAIFVYNLQPRLMMGQESHGMILTAQTENHKTRIITPDLTMANGSVLK
jgi:methionyl-tRNA synthetase